ncbi:DUF294 nucleotidyltransferase-like domain-containing protein [Pseudomonas aeruginosa]
MEASAVPRRRRAPELSHGADARLVRLERDGPGLGIVTHRPRQAHFRDGRSELEAIGRWPMVRRPASSWAFLFDAMIPMTRPAYRGGSRSGRGRSGDRPVAPDRVLSLFSTHSTSWLRIARADDLGDLRRCAETLDTLIATLAGNGIRPALIMQLVSAQRTVARTASDCCCRQPLRGRCCLLVMGSEGRGEQLRRPTRTCPGPGQTICRRNRPGDDAALSAALLEFGYPPCPGG